MTPEQIIALIKKLLAEYIREVDQHYLAMLTSDNITEHNTHQYQADMATGQVAALSRLQYAIEHPDVEV
jgi:hypothetical protein